MRPGGCVCSCEGGSQWVHSQGCPARGPGPGVLAIIDLIAGQPDTDPLSSLTGREAELLVVLATGSYNRAIAGKLPISENNVKSHVSSILDKLQVKNRTQASDYALSRGLGDGPSVGT